MAREVLRLRNSPRHHALLAIWASSFKRVNGDSIGFAGFLGFTHIRPKCEPERALQNAGVPSTAFLEEFPGEGVGDGTGGSEE